MNAWTPPPTNAPHTDAPQFADGDAATVERQLALLGRLAEVGMDIVEAIRRQVVEPPLANVLAPNPTPSNTPPHLNDLALAYGRAARAVRMSIALQSRLMAERRDQVVAQATASRVAAVRDRPARRARIDRIVERLASAEHADDEAVERCMAEAAERLEDVDVFGDILSRPVSETIALICRDLGLSPDWPALAEEAWAREEIATGRAGAPLQAIHAVIPETAPRLSGTQQRASHPPPLPPSPQGLSLGRPPRVRGP